MKNKRKILLIGMALCISLTGCNASNKQDQSSSGQASTSIQALESSLQDNVAFRKADTDIKQIGLIINNPTEEEIQNVGELETYEHDQLGESMLILPKYNDSKIELFTLDEEQKQKECVYSKEDTAQGFGLEIKAMRPEGMPNLLLRVSYKEQTVDYMIACNDLKDGEKKTEYLEVEKQNQVQNRDVEYITPIKEANYLEGLQLVKSIRQDITQDGQEELLELYTEGTRDASGNYSLDDGQEWALVVRKGEEIYPLFERTFIQLGTIKYTTYIDYDTNNFHVLVDRTQGAGIVLYDCYYDKEEGQFKRSTIYETSGNIGVIYEWKK